MLWVLIAVGVYLVINIYFGWQFLHPIRYPAQPIADTDEFMMPGPGGATPLDVSNNFHTAKVVFICIHGYGGNRNSFNDIAAALIGKGYGVLIPAMPGQDASPYPTVGFGPVEAETVDKTVDYCHIQNPTARVVLLGVSLGGAASWIEAGTNPRHIDAVVTESSFSRLAPLINTFLGHDMPLGALILRPSVWVAELLSGIKVSQINPIDEASKWKGIGLIIQDGSDRLVPPDQAQALSQAAHIPEWVIPGADHAGGFAKDPVGYLAHLDEVAHQVLKPAPIP